MYSNLFMIIILKNHCVKIAFEINGHQQNIPVLTLDFFFEIFTLLKNSLTHFPFLYRYDSIR
jgi:hypothetical protein